MACAEPLISITHSQQSLVMKNLHTLLSHPVVCRFVLLRFMGLACGLSGCVPATAYEQAASAADVEREGHRRAQERLVAAQQELDSLRSEQARLQHEKAELSRRLKEEQSQLAQASLDVETGRKETEQQEELVTQLRGELARVGEHIKSYAGQKSDLEQQLEQTQLELVAREQRIATLESEVGGLSAAADQSAQTTDQLNDALAELSTLQGQVENQAEAPSEPARADEPQAHDEPPNEDEARSDDDPKASDDATNEDAPAEDADADDGSGAEEEPSAGDADAPDAETPEAPEEVLPSE